MKCIHCQRDCKYPERSDGKCPGCKHRFAFEPRTGDPITDGLFHHAIEAVSVKGGVRWGVEHLYYEVCRRKRGLRNPVPTLCLVWGLCAMFLIVALTHRDGRWWIPTLALGAVSIGLTIYASRSRFVKFDVEKFDALWKRWCSTHGTPKGVIMRREQPKQPRQAEPDLGDYSFDRAVICDRARTVDLLVANNFHFENNCAVLSIDGYPPGPFETVRKMLLRNPQLQVFALHDATPDGCRLAHKLATDRQWFAGRVKVVDIGLRPSHAGPFRGLFQEASKSVTAGDGITAEEAQWLGVYALELAAVRPEQVLKRLFRAINRKPDTREDTAADGDVYIDSSSGGSSGNGGGSWIERDDASFSTDAGDSDGGADSFG